MITLASLHEASAQNVFDQVRDHLLTQMRKSRGKIVDNGIHEYCKYRQEIEENEIKITLKCAAGCLISDNEYRPIMETTGGWIRLIEHGFASDDHQDLIVDLQWIHDKFEPENWSEELSKVAKKYILK